MQKTFILVVVSVAALVGCRQSTGSKFTVNGKITNAPQKTIYLSKVAMHQGDPETVASAELNANGEFRLVAPDDEESLYEISFDTMARPDVVIVNDSKEFTVNYDAKNLAKPEFKGSAGTQAMYDLFDDFNSRQRILWDAANRVDSAAIQGQNTTALIQDRDERQKVLMQALKDYVAKAPSPGVAYYAHCLAGIYLKNNEMVALVTASSNRFSASRALAWQKELYLDKAAMEGETTNSGYPLLRKQAPELALSGLDGQPLSISMFRGKYVLVDFWASWCAPCRAENPNLVKAFTKYKNRSFTILGVSLDSDRGQWKDAVESDGLVWNHMSDLKGWNSEAVKTYNFDAVPFNVLLNPSGEIIAYGLKGEYLAKKLEEVFSLGSKMQIFDPLFK